MHVDGTELARGADAPVVRGASAGAIDPVQHADVGVQPDVGERPHIALEVRVERLRPRSEVVGGIGQVKRQVLRSQPRIDLRIAGVIAARPRRDVFRARHAAIDGQHGVQPLGVADGADQAEQAGVVAIGQGAEGRLAEIEARRIVVGQVDDAHRTALADRIAAHLIIALHAELARDLGGGRFAARGGEDREETGSKPETDQLTVTPGRALWSWGRCSRRP